MGDRQEVAARIGDRWGEAAVLLLVDGEIFRVPLPPQIADSATEGRLACIYLNTQGRLDGWALPDEAVGVRMDAEQTRWGSSPATLDCQGRCQTLWYVVTGGTVSPDDGCLTCGGPVAAA
jgi:hypothetical protein